MKHIVSTAAVIIQDDTVLLCKRPLSSAHFAGYWEFPGGKTEPGEHPEEALARELMEELGIIVEFAKERDFNYDNYTDRTILLLVMECSITGGTPETRECDEVKWVTADELKELSLPDSDEYVRRYALKRLTEKKNDAAETDTDAVAGRDAGTGGP